MKAFLQEKAKKIFNEAREKIITEVPIIFKARVSQVIQIWVQQWDELPQDLEQALFNAVPELKQQEFFHWQVERQAEMKPDAKAKAIYTREIATEDKKEISKDYTYVDINNYANQIAHYLQELNLPANSLIGLFLEPSFGLCLCDVDCDENRAYLCTAGCLQRYAS